jgi:hypothetical protein
LNASINPPWRSLRKRADDDARHIASVTDECVGRSNKLTLFERGENSFTSLLRVAFASLRDIVDCFMEG